jgi:nucleoside-diphosphate-sugar epimerase
LVTVVFVAGATGYTGREVVRALAEGGARTVAHVRPDSSKLTEWSERFTSMGAEVDTTAWDEGALTETLKALAPTQVYALLGTTRHRAKGEGLGAAQAYERIDYGLTAMLIRAAVACGSDPRFVYLSSAGVSEGTRNPYMRARARAEADLRASGLPFTIARPSFITGADRDDSRPMERVGAAFSDAALAFVGALGAKGVRARYRSTTNTVLARALVRLGADPAAAGQVADADSLR